MIFVLLGFLFAFIYVVSVVFRQPLAGYIANVLKNHTMRHRDYHTLWKDLDTIRFHRKFVIFSLIILIGVICFGIWSVIPSVISNTNLSYLSLELILLFVILVPIVVYAIELLKHYGVGSFSVVEHGKRDVVASCVESLGIATGFGILDLKIISHSAPTLFITAPLFSRPTIYVTSAFLNLASQSELEAALAYEYSQIVSGKLSDYKVMDTLIIFLQIFSLLFFVFLLLAFHQEEIAVLLGFLSLAFISPRERGLPNEILDETGIPFDNLIDVFFPPFAVVHFLSDIITNYFAQDEVYWADLYSVYITRHPRALYSILNKLNEFKPVSETLPRDFLNSYFTHDSLYYSDDTLTYPRVKQRLENLTLIDGFAPHKSSEEKNVLRCSLCDSFMNQLNLKGSYGAAVCVDFCPTCGSVWYDHLELYSVFDFPEIQNIQIQKSFPKNEEYLCPKCQIKLVYTDIDGLSGDIVVWYCKSCKGNFVEPDNVQRVIAFRQAKLEKHKSI